MIKIKAVFFIRKKHPKSGPKPPKKLNAARLKNPIVKNQIVNQVNNTLDMLQTGVTVKEKRTLLKKAVYETTKICLEKPERKHEDWFDKDNVELDRLLNDRNQARSFLNRSTRGNKTKLANLRP